MEATVAVTLPPPPSVTFSANPTSITSGQTSTLTWSSTGATSCSASGGWSGTKAASGTETTATLAANATFTLTCSNAGGSTPSSVTVTVTAPPPPSPTGNLTVVFIDNGGFSPGSPAYNALQNIASLITNTFNDNTTLRIRVGMAPLSGGVFGSTAVSSINKSYGDVRTALVADQTSTGDALAVQRLQPGPAIGFAAL